MIKYSQLLFCVMILLIKIKFSLNHYAPAKEISGLVVEKLS